MFGIDVSQFQGIINWEKVKPQIDFAILRLGWIGKPGNHTMDTQFERNYYECRRLGIPVGVYVYCYSDTAQAAESGAVWAVERLWGKELQMPVYIDMEDESLTDLGKDALMDIIVTFNTVIERSGYWAGVYANAYWYEYLLPTAEIKKKYTTWIADYIYETDKYKGQYDMWQYSDKGCIDGIEGDVDTNLLYRDLISDIKESQRKTYVVRPGDTLWSIAQRYGTTWQALAEKNGIKDPNRIYPGQVLKI